jgi:transcriptional antiterminator RfaH
VKPVFANLISEETPPPVPVTAPGFWFCLRTQPKHEHIAAAHLRQRLELEVFLPRIRYKRRTRQGVAWVSEALFVSYLFARFDLEAFLRRVQHARGVRTVIHFGDRWPTIPEGTIEELRAFIGDEELRVIPDALNPGDTVEIAGGAFHGLEAVVSRVMPGKERVAILLDFLGRQTAMELSPDCLIRKS